MAVTLRPTTLRRFLGPIGVVLFLLLTAWFAHDGWFNPEYQPGGAKQDMMWFNRIAAMVWPLFIIGSIVVGIRIARESILLDETGISVNQADPIALSSITEIDDSTYDENRFLRVLHKDADGHVQTLTVDAQKYDGVDEFLDELFDLTRLPSKAAAARAEADAKPAEKQTPSARPADDAGPDRQDGGEQKDDH